MTISKYARNESFGNEIFAGMDDFLKAEFPEAVNPLEKKAALEKSKVSAFGELVEALVSTAEVLEQLEHPKAKDAFRILAFIEKEMIKKAEVYGEGEESEIPWGGPFGQEMEDHIESERYEEETGEEMLSEEAGPYIDMAGDPLAQIREKLNAINDILESEDLDNEDQRRLKGEQEDLRNLLESVLGSGFTREQGEGTGRMRRWEGIGSEASKK